VSVFDRRPRAVLDTNVIGCLLADGAGMRPEFTRMARADFAFHINYYVLDEVCAALLARVLLPREVATLLVELLDPGFPVLPYQHYLYGLAGFGGTPIEECVAHTRAATDTFVAWRDLAARTDRFEPPRASMVDGQTTNAEATRLAYAESLAPPAAWKRTGNEHDVPGLLAQAVPEMRRRFDVKYGVKPNPPASVRCDAHIRSYALLCVRQWFDGKPPDLTSKRQRGTMYDQCMLDGLAIPAYLITNDEPFRARVRASGTYQASWILSASEFLDACATGSVGPLAFPESVV
jgi:rRNA-processing protein FCF1